MWWIDVERLLFAFKGLDLHLKVGSSSSAQFSSKLTGQRRKDSDSESESDSGEFNSKRRGKRIVRGQIELDDEYDLWWNYLTLSFVIIIK